MKRKRFKRMIDALSGEHGLEILDVLSSREWLIATDVATELKIHTTTASKYLTRFYEVGILDRRTRRCRTREAYEYHLRSPRIFLDLDVATNHEEDFDNVCEFYSTLLFKILKKTDRVGWAVTSLALEKALSDAQDSCNESISCLIACIDFDGGPASTMRNLREAIRCGEARYDMADLKGAFAVLYGTVLDLCSEGVGSNTTRRIFQLAVETLTEESLNLALEHGLFDAFPEDIQYEGL